MALTATQTLITIALIALATMITRYLPFILFPEQRPVPAYVEFLGRMLPPAMMGLLVVFCFKGVSLRAAPFGLPELIACAAIVLLHRWKSNVLLSIGGGTALYMALLRLLF